MSAAAINHSPLFFVDEAALKLGTRAMLASALDYLGSGTNFRRPPFKLQ